jgi:hypothetical protein
VTRPEELALIAAHIELYGVRRYPPHYACETAVYLPAGIVAARLAEIEARPPLEYARLLHQLLTAWRGRR